MSKIVIAANAMIENKNRISNVVPGINGIEVFFLFDGKYKWSIIERDDGAYALVYYPGKQTLEELAGMQEYEWGDFAELVYYNSKDIGTRESEETFRELYKLVTDMKYGMDDILDNIINSVGF
jgi:hypothetical protein